MEKPNTSDIPSGDLIVFLPEVVVDDIADRVWQQYCQANPGAQEIANCIEPGHNLLKELPTGVTIVGHKTHGACYFPESNRIASHVPLEYLKKFSLTSGSTAQRFGADSGNFGHEKLHAATRYLLIELLALQDNKNRQGYQLGVDNSISVFIVFATELSLNMCMSYPDTYLFADGCGYLPDDKRELVNQISKNLDGKSYDQITEEVERNLLLKSISTVYITLINLVEDGINPIELERMVLGNLINQSKSGTKDINAISLEDITTAMINTEYLCKRSENIANSYATRDPSLLPQLTERIYDEYLSIRDGELKICDASA